MENNEELLVSLCKRNGWTVSTAESCTGGLVGAAIVNIPGASDVYEMGFITYANRAKISCIHVSELTIKNHGAVSAECALEMANGCRIVSGSDIGIAVTGIAGPAGGTEEKPVGLVYIAVSDPDGDKVTKNIFSGNREEIRKQAVQAALKLAVESIN